MTRRSTDPDDLGERDMRRLAALVPRYGQQRHPEPTEESVDPDRSDPDHVVGQLPYEWRTP